VVLLEGTRSLPKSLIPRIITFAENLTATLGIFFVNPKNPLSGVTGHTINICKQNNVPVLFQDDWLSG